jgi:hypothetical protein
MDLRLESLVGVVHITADVLEVWVHSIALGGIRGACGCGDLWVCHDAVVLLQLKSDCRQCKECVVNADGWMGVCV